MTETAFDFDLLVQGGFPLKSYAPDEKIFVQEDDGDCMYVVRSGSVGIMTSGAVLETVGPNGTFGEMALMDSGPRSATAVAREPTEVAIIDEKAFLYLVQQNPAFALDLMRKLARRLRRMNESL
jgi:CRP/FNR family transcriptional regulator, cyclic AMP receptor protein